MKKQGSIHRAAVRGPFAVSAAAAVLLAPMLVAPAAQADPAPVAEATAFAQASGEQAVTVPNGVCAVNVIIGGGRGGVSIGEGQPGTDDTPEVPGEESGVQGSGARIGATLSVQAGAVLDLNVGGDGTNSGYGGLNGGANGSLTGHSGGGGDGFTTLSYDGNLLLLAGGGGGSGGGHQPGYGSGGDAGYGASTQADRVDLGNGWGYPASDGGGGWDTGSVQDAPENPTGGGGATALAGGAGGVNTHSVYTEGGINFDGFAGTAEMGGAGGFEPSLDGAGGGGGGLFGGGGGAGTRADLQTGSGGGGGSSFISNSALLSNITLENNRLIDEKGHAQDAEPAFASFEWIMCDYNLEIAKSVVGNLVFEGGSTVRYAVTVTNAGADPMVLGDTVTLFDDLAAGGTIVAVDGLDTSDPAVGDEIGAAGEIELFDLVETRPASDGVAAEYAPRGLAVGDSVTVVYDVVVHGTEPVTNTVSVADRNGISEASAIVDPAAPSLSLVKSADVEKVTEAGQKITYSFLVTNTGNIALDNISIAEGEFSGKGSLADPTCPEGPVEPEASVTCTTVYTTVAADLTGKDLTNTATAEGSTPIGALTVSDEADAKVVTVKPAPLAVTGGSDSSASIGLAALLLVVLGTAGLLVARLRKVA